MPSKTPIPKQSGTLLPRLIPALFCLGAVAVAVLLYDRVCSSYDDGVAAEAARLILRGKAPYRDFWAIYGPGSYYVNAGAMAVMGESMNSVRLMLLPVVLIQAALLYGIVRRLVKSGRVMIVAAVAYLAFIPVGQATISSIVYWSLFATVALYCLLRWTEDPRPAWEYALGLVSGLAVLFRQDGGLYFAVALVPLIYLTAPKVGARGRASAVRVAASIALVVGVVLAWFAMHGALASLIEDVFTFPVFVFPHVRSWPYPLPWDHITVIGKYTVPGSAAFAYQLWAFYALPAALAFFGLNLLLRLVREEPDRRRIAVTMFCLLALVLFMMARTRPSSTRLLMTIVLSIVVFAALTSDRRKWLRTSARIMLAWGAISLLPVSFYTVWGHRTYGVSPVAGIQASRGHAQLLNTTASEIAKLTRPSEKILSGSPLIYILAKRDPVTPYFEPHPGVTDTPRFSRLIIQDIERERMRYFVRSREWQRDGYFTIEEKNQPRIIIDYIEDNYKPIRNIYLFEIYERVTPFED